MVDKSFCKVHNAKECSHCIANLHSTHARASGIREELGTSSVKKEDVPWNLETIHKLQPAESSSCYHSEPEVTQSITESEYFPKSPERKVFCYYGDCSNKAPHTFASVFKAPSKDASEVVRARCSTNVEPCSLRYRNVFDTNQLIVFTDGTCFKNSTALPRAGYSFLYAPTSGFGPGAVYARLEMRAIDGSMPRLTSQRAGLRAAIAVLQFRKWHLEGFRSIVIATDSEYVVKGATVRAKKWLQSDWKTRGGQPVPNHDLWLALLMTITAAHEDGLSVSCWWIRSADNAAAVSLSRRGAMLDQVPSIYSPTNGISA